MTRTDDEREGQRDDADERERQARLERPRRRACRSALRKPPAPCRPSALGEGVADTSDGQDEGRRGRVVLDLVAQVADVDVDRLLVLVERLVVAEQLEQLAAGVDAARPRGEVAQDLELGRASG